MPLLKPLFLLVEQATDFIGEFQELIWVLLNSSLFAQRPPFFSSCALHMKGKYLDSIHQYRPECRVWNAGRGPLMGVSAVPELLQSAQ
ncbi:MAG: hypothetical protein JO159_19075 [Acidobacteria bacterium]|nr:hypothetical protein [Acidobacteriota bacterium]